MPLNMSPELYWLAAVSVFTSLLWVPYILQLIGQMGLQPALWDPYHETPHEARWAQRAKRAHTNAIENIAVFAPLAISLHLLAAGTPLTAKAAALFFAVRVAHYVAYVAAVPVVRTLLFFTGFLCQLTLAARLFGWLSA